MVETAEAMGGQQWDAVVTRALDASGVDGTAMLGGTACPVAIPFGLEALMGALLHFLAPEAPRRLRVYTYDVLDVGCLLEVRGGRELAALPQQLIALGEQLGVRLNFSKLLSASSVLLTLPSQY